MDLALRIYQNSQLTKIAYFLARFSGRFVINGVFSIIYLIVLSWSADRFHKYIQLLGGLKFTLKQPKVIKGRVYADRARFQAKLDRHKKRSYLIVFLAGALHQLTAIADRSDHFTYGISLADPVIWSPPLFCLGTLLILLIIFWLKGRMGGIPARGRSIGTHY